MRKKNYPLLDLCRLPAALLVIAIHISPLAAISGTGDFILTRIIARIGVPFFIMITGYFILPSRSRFFDQWPRLISEVKKCALFYIIAILLYLPVNIYAGQLPLWTSRGTLDPWWFLRLVKWLFIDGTFYHLWYFPALIMGLVLTGLLLSRFSHKTVIILAAFLYLLGLMGDSYFGLTEKIPGISQIYDGIFTVSTYTRNGLFYVPLFLMLGRDLQIRRSHAKTTASFLFAGGALILMTGEGLILHHFHLQRHDSMYLFLPLVMYALFNGLSRAGLNLGSRPEGRARGKRRFALLGKITLVIYVIHPMVIIALRGGDRLLGLNGRLSSNNLLMYFFTCTLSLIFAVFFWLIVKKAGSILRSSFKKKNVWRQNRQGASHTSKRRGSL